MPEQLPRRVVIPEFRIENPEQIKVNGGEDVANAKRLEGVSVRFRIEKTLNAVMNKAKISLANLSRPDVEYLTSFTSWALEIEKRKRIRLFAGYEGQNVGLIFDGDITSALPSLPPDEWLEVEALSGFYDNQNVASISIEGETSFKEICEKVAQELGLSLRFHVKTDRYVDGFTYQGGARNVIYKLNDLFQACAYQDGKTLYVRDLEQEYDGTAKLINEESGLIGIPHPGPLGVDLTVLLDPTIELGKPIKLESKRIPSASGVYYPYALVHEGESRGNPFYTHLKCQRFKL